MISLDEKRWSGEWHFHRVVELGGAQIPRSALFFGSESWRQCFLRRQEPELHNRNGTLHVLGFAYFCAIVCTYWPPPKLVCTSWLQRQVYVACRAEPWQAAHNNSNMAACLSRSFVVHCDWECVNCKCRSFLQFLRNASCGVRQCRWLAASVIWGQLIFIFLCQHIPERKKKSIGPAAFRTQVCVMRHSSVLGFGVACCKIFVIEDVRKQEVFV